MKKRLLAVLVAAVTAVSLLACGGGSSSSGGSGSADAGSGDAAASDMKVAMVTDYGDITDQSFNQTTYEACKAFTEANKIDFTYYKPEGDSTAEREAMIDKAVADGYNVLVLPGYAFAEAIVAAAETYPEVKFVALDVSEYDLCTAAGTDTYSLWQATRQSRWATRSSASSAAWLFPQLSVTATASWQAPTTQLRKWVSQT